MPLTHAKLRALLAKPEPGKYADGAGLFIRVYPSGSMLWQCRMRTPAETTVSFGRYPEVSLAEARAGHRQARELHRAGINPNKAKRDARLAQAAATSGSFELVAREWFDIRRGEWAASYASKVIARLEADVFPYVGKLSIADISPSILLPVLRRIEDRGAIETAHRALENCGQVFRYAVAIGRIASDPSRDLKGALQKPMVRHMAAITDPDEMGGLLRAIHGYSGTNVVRAALQLAPMLIVRPGELRFARWQEFDLDQATWTIPAVRMKRQQAGKLNGSPHLVPLANQAVTILRELFQLTGHGDLVFRGERDHERAMSENTVNAALRQMGFDTANVMTGHGFRASARTILDEKLGIDREVIEAQLAHSVSDSLGRAYNRTNFFEQRRRMMQAWADCLDDMRCNREIRRLATH